MKRGTIGRRGSGRRAFFRRVALARSSFRPAWVARFFAGKSRRLVLLTGFLNVRRNHRSRFLGHSAAAADFSVARRHLHATCGVGIAGEFAGLRQPSISLGNRAYGLQFHLEVSQGMAKEWLKVPEYDQALNDVLDQVPRRH